MIIWLASYPRSGNTFLRIVLKTYFDLPTYSKYNDRTDIGAGDKFSKLVGHQNFEEEWSEFYQASRDSSDVRVIKTHDAPEGNEKAIYLIRDGRASMVSYQNYLANYSKLSCDLNDVITGSVNFGSWSDHVNAWAPLKRPNTLLLKFEDLIDDTSGTVTKLAEFLGLKPKAGVVPTFEKLRAEFPQFFKTGSNSKNLDQISLDQMAYINFISGSTLSKYGYADKTPIDLSALARIQKSQSDKLWTTKREIVALTDTKISSKLESRLVEIKSLVSDIASTSRQDENSFHERLVSLNADLFSKISADVGERNTADTGRIIDAGKQLTAILQQKLSALDKQLETGTKTSAKQKEIKGLSEKIDRFGELLTSILNLETAKAQSIEQQEKKIKSNFQELRKAFDAQGKHLGTAIAKLETSVSDSEAEKLLEMEKHLRSIQDDYLSRIDKLGKRISLLHANTNKTRKANHEKTEKNLDGIARELEAIIEEVGEQGSKELRTQIRSLRAGITTQNSEISASIADMGKSIRKAMASDTEHLSFVKRTDEYIAELKAQSQQLFEISDNLQHNLDNEQLKTAKLKESVVRFAAVHDEMRKKLFELETVLEPRFKSLLEFRPWKYVIQARRKLKLSGGEIVPDHYVSSNEIINQAERSVKGKRRSMVDQLKLFRRSKVVVEPAPRERTYRVETNPNAKKAPLGIAVFTHDRKHLVHNVLESLAQQDALDKVHVWIDGDQGKPDKRKILDETEALVHQYNVKQIHRNRGNFGFRKMMIMSQRYMLQRYENIIFLEDDCFPKHNAVSEFMKELDGIRNDAKVFSVYGHPFLVPGEGKYFDRFQGWGWATTSEKLLPIWNKLLEMYLMTEDEYLQRIKEILSPEIIAKIDITPGRLPTDTIKNFFAWDETLCLLVALEGMTHKKSKERLIYNCGAGDCSSHFTKIEYYRKPPFNMIAADEVWDYF
jgi:Sulfotransferase domain